MTLSSTSPDTRVSDPAPSGLSTRWTAIGIRHGLRIAILALAGLCALPFDVSFSRVVFREKSVEKLSKVLNAVEPFGNSVAVVVLLAAIYLCGGVRRSAIPRLLLASIGAGLMADLGKLLIARSRPHQFDFAGSVADTFHGWLPGTSAGSALQSCPSGHVATATGLALALGMVFPAGRRFFAGLAGIVALQRIQSGSHFLSDTLWGAAVGYSIAMILFDPRFLGSWFDRGETPGGVRASEPSQIPAPHRESIPGMLTWDGR